MTQEVIPMKPCPFCGGAALVNGVNGPHGDPWASVECADCGCEVGDGVNLPAAIAAWNQRAHLPTDLSEERAREVLAEAQRGKPDRHLGLVSHADALRAMQQYAAGLQGEVERLRDGYDALAALVDYLPHPHCVTATDAIRTALGDTQ